MNLLNLVPLREIPVLVLEIFSHRGGAAFTTFLDAGRSAGLFTLEAGSLEVSTVGVQRELVSKQWEGVRGA